MPRVSNHARVKSIQGFSPGFCTVMFVVPFMKALAISRPDTGCESAPSRLAAPARMGPLMMMGAWPSFLVLTQVAPNSDKPCISGLTGRLKGQLESAVTQAIQCGRDQLESVAWSSFNQEVTHLSTRSLRLALKLPRTWVEAQLAGCRPSGSLVSTSWRHKS